MKRWMQVLVVFALLLVVGVIFRASPAWASVFPVSEQAVPMSPRLPANILNAPLAFRQTISEDGLYNIGGVCLFEVKFKDPEKIKKLKIDADAEIPLKESTLVPFGYEDEELFFPGCHFVHYKLDEKINPMSTEDAETEVCFGNNPDFKITIYYYLDNPPGGSPVWIPLGTWVKDNNRLVCANAPYTGVYMPAGKIIPPEDGGGGGNGLFPGSNNGSVLAPPDKISFSAPGTYAVGGVCIIRADYYVPRLSNNVWVAYPEDDTLTVPFPNTEDLLYFPGCHVFHFRDAVLKEEMNKSEQEGEWEICFAARPEKIMTIYYYRTDLENIAPPWVALPSTTENGLVCAKTVNYTAIYTPAGK